MVRWGILGTARIGRTRFLPGLRQSSRGEPVAIASRNREKAEAFARENAIPRVFHDYESLLRSDAIDAAYIPLPNSMHCEWTVAAAQNGKHVFCEKPLAMNQEEAERMLSACRVANVLCFEAFVFLYHPQTLGLLKLLEQGAIGTLLNLHSCFCYRLERPSNNIRLKREFGGGSLMDVGSYSIAFARCIFRSEPTSIQAQLQTDEVYGVDTQVGAILRMGGDRLAIIEASFDTMGGAKVTLRGSEGSIEIEQPFHPPEGSSIRIVRGNQEETVSFETGLQSFVPAIDHFHDCILDGVEPISTAQNALGTIRVMEAIRESAAAGRVVEL